MGEQKRTIYQEINKFLGLDAFIGVQNKDFFNQPDVIIKGDSPQDVKRKSLELQQKDYLKSKFYKVQQHGFQKALQYEAQRLPAYVDYEGMEWYPIISAALNLFMEESTTIGDDGKMLHIYSNNERIKNALEDLFYTTININTNLPSWCRAMCKFGDNFTYIYGEKEKGIIFLKQMVNYEIEREDKIEDGRLITRFKQRGTNVYFENIEMAHFRLLGDDKYLPYGSSILNKIRRTWKQLVLAEDSMLTYRILRAGDKRVFKIPVGNMNDDDVEAYIERIVNRFKKVQQINPNNATIDYRFNIMGNDEDYFIPVRSENSGTMIDTLQGACLALDTKIELLDGRSITLSDLIKEFEENKELWSYSINPETGEIVPGKITWAGVTRKNTQVLKITLDNGETITCTPDHKFPTKYNGFKEAKDLHIGESMWSFNKKFEKIKNQGNEYEMIYDHSKNDWIFTHRMVNSNLILDEYEYSIQNGDKNTIHHKDFNRFNNNPSNLIRMNNIDHMRYHSQFSENGGEKFKLKYENDLNFKNKIDEILFNGRKIYHEKLKNDNEFKVLVSKKQSKSAIKYYDSLTNDEKYNRISKLNSEEARLKAINTFKNNPFRIEIINSNKEKIKQTKQIPENRIRYSNNTKNLWKNDEFKNLVITKQKIKYSNILIDLLVQYSKIYANLNDILSKEININNSQWLNEFWFLNSENKQLQSKMKLITRNNIDKLLKFYGYKNWRDFYSKINQYNHKITSIEWLEEKQDTGTITIDGNEELHNYHTFALSAGIFTKNSNLDQIQDIEYLRDNLFMGLEIPRPFLSYQSAGGEGKNMAQFDVRFAKKVNRIQQSLLQELNKIAVIHLYYLGYRGEELTNFKMMLTNPSTQSDILKNELLEAKARVYEAMTKTTEGSIAAMSHYMAKKTILNMSDSQIIQDIKIQRIERAISQELQDTPLIIKNTGIFKDVDDRYGSGEALPLETATSGGTTGAAAAPGAGTTLPGEGSPEQLRPPTANAANQGETFTSPSELPPVQGKTESILGRTENLLNEYINVISNNKEIEEKSKDLILYNQKLNENAFKLIKDNEKINGTEEHNSINFSNYEDSDELYENIMKLKEDILKSQLDDLNKTKI